MFFKVLKYLYLYLLKNKFLLHFALETGHQNDKQCGLQRRMFGISTRDEKTIKLGVQSNKIKRSQYAKHLTTEAKQNTTNGHEERYIRGPDT